MRQARNSFDKPYDCKLEWPEDCGLQCGGTGIVLASGSLEKTLVADEPLNELSRSLADKKSYITAFFEAFPKNPDTFIRGEGKTIEEAEKQAWDQLQKHLQCPGHEFERRTYKNGAGFCKHCDLFKPKAFEPETKCCICQTPTNYSCDKKDLWYCQKDRHLMPEENKPEWMKEFEKSSGGGI